jgi:putative transposase
MVARPEPTERRPQGLCLDKGYDDEVRDLAQEFGLTLHLRTRGEEIAAIKQDAEWRARRSVVERATPGSTASDASSIRREKRPENYLAMLNLACAPITWRQHLMA